MHSWNFSVLSSMRNQLSRFSNFGDKGRGMQRIYPEKPGADWTLPIVTLPPAIPMSYFPARQRMQITGPVSSK
jgi:hypothetical protein